MAGVHKLPYIWPGTRFGRLTVIAECAPPSGATGRHYFCQCECGEGTLSKGQVLLNGKKTSCGCFAVEMLVNRSRTHGHGKIPNGGGNGSRTYISWIQMRQRCLNSKHTFYKDYGGRGITICDQWTNSFENFLADMGERPSKTSLDRIDNSKGYSPDNCRWSSQKEQCRNTRKNLSLTFEGETFCAAEWAEITGLPLNAIIKRHKSGWSIEDVLTRPLRQTIRDKRND